MAATITDINQLNLQGTYTYVDYLSWQFEEMVELIRGKVWKMSPAPSRKHQQVSRNLQHFISNFLWKKKCQLFSAPFDVRFSKGKSGQTITTITQPDICVVCDPMKLDDAGCLGAPDFIIEILSPATKDKDIHEKYSIYEEYGVREYWIIDPVSQILDVFVLEGEKYKWKGKYTESDSVHVFTLPGLEIDLKEVFEIEPK